jgi:hypothetical protein
MAMGTTDHKVETTPQRPTQGIGTMGKPDTTVLPPAEPMLPPDIDPVLLVKVYPEATSAAEMRAQAMAAGKAAQEQGAALEAAQQEGAAVEAPPPEPSMRVPGAAHQPEHKPNDRK